MDRAQIFNAIKNERAYQEEKWGAAFDKRNTINDWVTYICRYATNAAFPTKPGTPMDRNQFTVAMVKVAALAVAALETIDEDSPAKRHYDD